MKTQKILFKGENTISFRIGDEKNETGKHRILSYKVLLCDETCNIVASQETSDHIVACFEDERIVAVLRKTVVDGESCFVPVNGVFAAVWCEQIKKRKQYCFAWSHLNSEFYQHFEVKSFGLEDEIILKVFDYIFKCLKGFLYEITKKENGFLKSNNFLLESTGDKDA